MFNRLVRHFGSPQDALTASANGLSRVKGMTPQRVKAVLNQGDRNGAEREIERSRKKGYRIITQADARYPALLLNISDPPPLLYCKGDLDSDDCHIAVVGTRKATAYGKTTAKSLCRDLAARGLSVVSGMARGIDTAAHLGALEGGGKTVAVLGSGLERVYPAENLKLFHRIAENGAVLTEFALDAEPQAHHFPQRNRIISGMALGTVVVEASKRSGSLITARLAAEQGREVYAVPGSIHAQTARGTHDLIRQGAKLIENAQDIIEEIIPQIGAPACQPNRAGNDAPEATALPRQQADVLAAMGPYPIHIDELARQCRMAVGPLSALLLQMELKGAVVQEQGKFFYARQHSSKKRDLDPMTNRAK